MSLVDTISAIFKRRTPAPETTTAMEQVRRSGQTGNMMERFAADRERRAIVKTCREMYESDPRAKKMLRHLSRDVMKGGYVLSIEGAQAEQAEEIANDLRKRLKLDNLLDDWVRLTARDGDTFLELEINQRLEIIEASRKPTLEMHRETDDRDRFADPLRAFWWADGMWMGTEPPQDAIWFPAWQIIHARWEHDEGSRYGTPMLASGTGAWKRVREGELDIAVRRKTRAGRKFLHVVEGADEAGLERYKEYNQAALDNPFGAVTDFFTNRAGSISALDGDAQLGNITDVLHHISTWFTAGDVPMELIAYGDNLNRDVLGEKKAEYEDTLVQIREWVAAELIEPLLERQWLLAGILPDGLSVQIEWSTQRQLTPVELSNLMNAVGQMRMLNWPESVITAVVMQYLPGIDAEMLAEANIEQAVPNEAERLAAIEAQLASGATAATDGAADGERVS